MNTHFLPNFNKVYEINLEDDISIYEPNEEEKEVARI